MITSRQVAVFAVVATVVVGGLAGVILWIITGLIWPSVIMLAGMVVTIGALEVLARLRSRTAATAAAAAVLPTPRFITQDGYAELLNRDRARMVEGFTWSAAATAWDCRACFARAELVSVFHPIWDGPFDEGGSGVVDRRDFPWCVRCEGPPPAMDGQPVRLPYLDQLPVRLRVELFERAAFHRLPVQVERYRPPAVP